MIQANLLRGVVEDTVIKDRVPAGAWLAAVLIVGVSAALAAVAFLGLSGDIEALETELDELHARAAAAGEVPDDIDAIRQHEDALRTFNQTAAEWREDDRAVSTWADLAEILAPQPGRGSSRARTFEENGWSTDFDIGDLTSWTLAFDNGEWTLNGVAENDEQVQELLRRAHSFDALNGSGFEAIAAAEEGVSFSLVTSANADASEAATPPDAPEGSAIGQDAPTDDEPDATEAPQ